VNLEAIALLVSGGSFLVTAGAFIRERHERREEIELLRQQVLRPGSAQIVMLGVGGGSSSRGERWRLVPAVRNAGPAAARDVRIEFRTPEGGGQVVASGAAAAVLVEGESARCETEPAVERALIDRGDLCVYALWADSNGAHERNIGTVDPSRFRG
jgi:hypothetical protein